MNRADWWQDVIEYMGERFDPKLANEDDAKVMTEFARYPDAETFYRETEIYIYHGLAYFLSGIKRPYYARLLEMLGQSEVTVLDYGCGTGDDGILFHNMGLSVSFADVQTKSLEYLVWKLERINISTYIYEIGKDVIPRHDMVWCMDVLEHLPPDQHKPLLETLATIGGAVFINLVSDPAADGRVHHPVNAGELVEFVSKRWDCFAQKFYGDKVTFLIYGEEVGLT